MLQKVSYAFFFKISEEKYIAGFTGYLKKKKKKSPEVQKPNHQSCPDSLLHFTLYFPNPGAWNIFKDFFF